MATDACLPIPDPGLHLPFPASPTDSFILFHRDLSYVGFRGNARRSNDPVKPCIAVSLQGNKVNEPNHSIVLLSPIRKFSARYVLTPLIKGQTAKRYTKARHGGDKKTRNSPRKSDRSAIRHFDFLKFSKTVEFR